MAELENYTVSVSDDLKSVGKVCFAIQAASPTQAAKIAATQDLIPFVDDGQEFERYVRVAGLELVDLYKVCFQRRSPNVVSFTSLEVVDVQL